MRGLYGAFKRCCGSLMYRPDICSSEFEPNAIDDLLRQYDSVRLIAFNGATAEKFFRQQVAASISDSQRFEMVRLPSTSPAHASMNLAQKLEQWRIILRYCA